jgi:flavin-binding protein dodecin
VVVFPIDGISTSSISCFRKIGSEEGNQSAGPRVAGHAVQSVFGGELYPMELLEGREAMSVGTYKIIELVGSSEVSWEEAAKNAVKTASKTLRDLRIAEVKQLDLKIEGGKVTAYRVRLDLSFKYEAK